GRGDRRGGRRGPGRQRGRGPARRQPLRVHLDAFDRPPSDEFGGPAGSDRVTTQPSTGGGPMQPFPGETQDYRTARNDLLRREIELRREMESVAAARPAPPPGGRGAEDSVF